MKKIKVIKDEKKVIPFIWINGEEKEVSLLVQLTGEGAGVEILGIFLGTNAAMITFNTIIIHGAKKTYSRTNLRSVMLDQSSFINDSMIRIVKGASGADGYFTSKVLLFDDAKGRSVPSLEIDENDLKAGHASTIGRPEEQQIFYLRSRGLSEKEAEKCIISGFFEPIITLLSKSQQKNVRKMIKNNLENAQFYEIKRL